MAEPAQHGEAGDDAVTRPTGWPEVWRMLAPWLGYLFLLGAAVLGLFTASGAEDEGGYAAGIATFILAALVIALRIKRQFDGEEVGFLLRFSIRNADALAVLIAILTLLALFGAVLASYGGTLYTVGLALTIVCALLIFLEIKRYFDARERGG